MKRFRLGLATLLLGVLSMLPAAAAFDNDPPKDAQFTFARIRFHMSFEGNFGRELPWHHDFPYAEEAFTTFVKQVTNIYTAPNAYQIVDIDSPDLFKFPFAYFCEPGFLQLSDKDAKNLREYLNRGGFLMVDDFRGGRDLNNLIYQMKKVFPNREIMPLDVSHPIFDMFYKIESLDVRPPYGPGPVQFYGLEDDHGRLVMVISYNHDIGEVWQWLDEGSLSLQDAADSLKFGTNYLMYSFTH